MKNIIKDEIDEKLNDIFYKIDLKGTNTLTSTKKLSVYDEEAIIISEYKTGGALVR